MRPVIAISSRIAQDLDWAPPLIGTRQAYVEAILAAGGAPMIVPIIDDLEALRRLYDVVDGVLLPGGEDIDPRHFAEAPHPQLGSVSPERDEVELQLARWAVAEGKPILAICRGIQVLNVALGGTLYQHLPAQLDSTIGHDRGGHSEDWITLVHPLIITPDSRLARLIGTCELQVNSLHHQAIKDLAPGLRVVGTAPDGVIEAVESTNGAFLLGLQCHPEMLWKDHDTRWRQVFRGFVEAASASRSSR